MMKDEPYVSITRDPRGYFTLMIDGEFAGNFDTLREAYAELKELAA